MRSRQLKAKIEFQRQAETKDQYGERSKSYETYCIRWGEPFGLSSSESEQEHGKTASVLQKFRVRYDSTTKTVSYSDRIKYNGAIFEIIAIDNKHNKNKELVFTGSHNERLT